MLKPWQITAIKNHIRAGQRAAARRRTQKRTA